MRWIDVGVEAHGFIAVGQFATGVIAIGQSALGVIAIGQVARGVFVVGQLALGVVSVGQLSLGVWWTAGMIGTAAQSPGLLTLPLLPRISDGEFARSLPLGTGRVLLAAIGLTLLAVIWLFAAGFPLIEDVFLEGGVLRPVRELR